MTPEILLLDPHARAGRTRHQLSVKDARQHRAAVRNEVGVSRDDLPTTRAIITAALHLSVLLRDATEGDARITIVLGTFS